MHLLALLCSLPALNKTMCPCKSASSGSVSVAKESSSDALACVNNFEGGEGAFNKLHCIATLFCSCAYLCISSNNANMLYMFTSMHTFTFVPAWLLYVQLHA